jgi:hypothetical protein
MQRTREEVAALLRASSKTIRKSQRLSRKLSAVVQDIDRTRVQVHMPPKAGRAPLGTAARSS